MTLDRTIIAGAPATTRADAKTVAGVITSAVPPDYRITVVDGEIVGLSQEPEREGQMLFYRNGSELFVTMYVVVITDHGANGQAILEWKEVKNWGVVKDPRTGLEKDPNAAYYSSLAT